MKQVILNKFEKYDKEFVFGVSGKMVSMMLPEESSESGVEDTESLLIDQFVELLKKGGRSESDILIILENFDRNSSVLKEWELEALSQERQNRLQVDLGIKKGKDQEQKSLLKEIKDLEKKRSQYGFQLPFA